MESNGPPGWYEPEQPARRSFVAPLLILLVLGLAGAVFYEEFDTGDEEQEIERLVVSVSDHPEPAMCTEVFTERWLETYFSSDDPIEDCQEESEDPPVTPSETTVSSISIDGDTARISGSTEGGSVGSVTFEAVLEDDGSGWRYDQLVDVDLNIDQFWEAQQVEIEEDISIPAVAKPLAECTLVWGKENLTEEELEAVALSGESSAYAPSIQSCLDEFEDAFFSPSAFNGDANVTQRQAECFMAEFRAALDESELEAFYVTSIQDEPLPSTLEAKRAEAAQACMGVSPSSDPAATA